MATSRISNTIKDPMGTAIPNVTVLAKLMPTAGFRESDFTEVARITQTTTNASGFWQLDLERNANITPDNSWYEITELIPDADGGKRVWQIAVGDSDQTLLASLVTPSTSQPTVVPAGTVYLTQASADARYQALAAIGATPNTIEPDDAANAGVSSSAARADHEHGIVADAASATNVTGNTEGSSTSFARADHGHLAPGTLGYAQVTANQTGISSETSLTGLSVTVTVVAGRRIKITGHTLVQGSVDTNRAEIRIKESTTVLQLRQAVSKQASHNHELTAIWVGTPSAGSHTYHLTLQGAVTGTSSLVADPTFPSFILVEDIGV